MVWSSIWTPFLLGPPLLDPQLQASLPAPIFLVASKLPRAPGLFVRSLQPDFSTPRPCSTARPPSSSAPCFSLFPMVVAAHWSKLLRASAPSSDLPHMAASSAASHGRRTASRSPNLPARFLPARFLPVPSSVTPCPAVLSCSPWPAPAWPPSPMANSSLRAEVVCSSRPAQLLLPVPRVRVRPSSARICRRVLFPGGRA
jgi:hypothetical protein